MKPVAELLKKKNLKLERGIYIVHGSEELLHKNFINLLKKIYGSVNIHYGEDLDLETFLQILGEKTLFTKNNTVNIIFNAERFFSKLRKKQKEKVVRLLQREIKNVVVVSILEDLKKGDLSKEPYKTLFSVAKDIFSAKPLNRKQVATLLERKFKSAGISFEPEVIPYLLESFSDLVQLKMEVEKLITYVGEGGKITLAETKELIQGNPQYTVFDFQKSFFDRDLEKSLKIFESLLEGLTSYERNALTLQLEGLILNTLNRLLVAKEKLSVGNKLETFARELGLFYPFQVAQFKDWLRLWDEKDIVGTLKGLYSFDQSVKLKFQPSVDSFRKFIFKSLK